MKKIIALTLVLVSLLAMASAIVPVTVIIGNKTIVTPAGDVQAQIINSRTLVPMRACFESLDCTVEYIASSKTVMATKGPQVIVLKVGSNVMTVSNMDTGESKNVKLDVAACMIPAADKKYGARTMVPLRAISESLDMKVDWDGKAYVAKVTSKK